MKTSLTTIRYIIFALLPIINSLFPFVAQTVKSSSVAGQETLIGITGNDFIVLGADSSISSSISLTSSNVDKIKVIVDPFPFTNGNNDRVSESEGANQQQVIVVASAGDSADSERLIGNLIAHASSMEYQHLGCDVKCIYNGNADAKTLTSTPLSSPAGLDAESLSYLARGLIASSLRSRQQMKTCLLIAGLTRCHQYSPSFLKQKEFQLNYEQNQQHNIDFEASYSNKLQKQVQAATEEFKLNEQENASKKMTNNIKNNNSYKQPSSSIILKPKLFWLDEYGSLQNVEYAAHGLASNFVLSILDRSYNSNLSKEEAIDLIMDCFQQLRKRFIINSPESPCIKCIDANGCSLISK